jgi:hypothetical protein
MGEGEHRGRGQGVYLRTGLYVLHIKIRAVVCIRALNSSKSVKPRRISLVLFGLLFRLNSIFAHRSPSPRTCPTMDMTASEREKEDRLSSQASEEGALSQSRRCRSMPSVEERTCSKASTRCVHRGGG